MFYGHPYHNINKRSAAPQKGASRYDRGNQAARGKSGASGKSSGYGHSGYGHSGSGYGHSGHSGYGHSGHSGYGHSGKKSHLNEIRVKFSHLQPNTKFIKLKQFENIKSNNLLIQ